MPHLYLVLTLSRLQAMILWVALRDRQGVLTRTLDQDQEEGEGYGSELFEVEQLLFALDDYAPVSRSDAASDFDHEVEAAMARRAEGLD